METLNKRLSLLIERLNFNSLRRFDDSIGVALGQTNNIVGEKQCLPGSAYLFKIKEKFPQVDLNWLISGEGEMFKDPNDFKKNSFVELLVQENASLKQKLQGLEFGLALAANSANFSSQIVANFNFVRKEKMPVNILFFKRLAHSLAHTGS